MRSRTLVVAAVTAALSLGAAGTAAADPPASGKPAHEPDVSGLRASPPRAAGPSAAPEADCPSDLACGFAPAGYAQNTPEDPTDYGNYDLAARPDDGLDLRYIVIHDTELGYDDTISLFQDPTAYVSAHYVVRSSDGEVTQMVPNDDVTWHAGNWSVNTHAIGIEIEGRAIEGNDWYTAAVYDSVSKLVRHLSAKYDIPLDRHHVIGHDEVPGTVAANQAGMHWDPGPYFDWQRLMTEAGAPAAPVGGDGRIVTIAPTFADNQPPVTDCEQSPCAAVPSQPSNFLYLRTAPSEDAPLIADPLLTPSGPGTTAANDWGDKAVTGQTFAVAGRQGDWTAIYYGGQKAWVHASEGSGLAPGRGTLVTPKPGAGSIPVYGRSYPGNMAGDTLGYTIPAGQAYVSGGVVRRRLLPRDDVQPAGLLPRVRGRHRLLRDLVQPPPRVPEGERCRRGHGRAARRPGHVAGEARRAGGARRATPEGLHDPRNTRRRRAQRHLEARRHLRPVRRRRAAWPVRRRRAAGRGRQGPPLGRGRGRPARRRGRRGPPARRRRARPLLRRRRR